MAIRAVWPSRVPAPRQQLAKLGELVVADAGVCFGTTGLWLDGIESDRFDHCAGVRGSVAALWQGAYGWIFGGCATSRR